jgi:hypothetical protein
VGVKEHLPFDIMSITAAGAKTVAIVALVSSSMKSLVEDIKQSHRSSPVLLLFPKTNPASFPIPHIGRQNR